MTNGSVTNRMGLGVAALALCAPLAAQEQTAPTRAMLTERAQVELARASVESRVIKGAPYSAEAVTETLHVLGDGNRISRKSVTRVYRDSEGRTRRETVAPSGEVTSINISDPIAATTYVLDPKTKTASKSGVFAVGRGGGATGFVSSDNGQVSVRRLETAETAAELRARQDVEAAAAAGARGAGGGGGRVRGNAEPAVAAATPSPAARPNTSMAKEELGSQIVEGVMATGSRSTTTIEAGAIGNVQPIHIVAEQWFSEDLKVLVMTRHSDPRSGTTTYRLTNLVLAEPARTLFDVPADYTLKESVIRRDNPLK